MKDILYVFLFPQADTIHMKEPQFLGIVRFHDKCIEIYPWRW